MKGIKVGHLLIALTVFNFTTGQSVEINGKVIVNDDEVEGIHVINKTANKFTITKDDGNFTIPAQLHDTIIFSAIKYKPKEVIVTAEIMKTKILSVYLSELVNVLNEVIVGKVLTGDLLLDIGNSDVKRDINFYDLGIPGYKGKPLTISENKLNEAGEFRPSMLFGLLMGSVPLNPIINGLSGRTKMLKNHVKLERLNACLESIKADFSKTLFANHELDEAYRGEFFYFCLEDEAFPLLCEIKNDIKTYLFLEEKLKIYKDRIEKN